MSQTPGATSSHAGVGRPLHHRRRASSAARRSSARRATHFARPRTIADRAERDDERHDAERGHEHAVQAPDRGRGEDPRQRREPGRRRPDCRSRATTTVASAIERADREIDAAADDDERHPDRAERDDDGLASRPSSGWRRSRNLSGSSAAKMRDDDEEARRTARGAGRARSRPRGASGVHRPPLPTAVRRLGEERLLGPLAAGRAAPSTPRRITAMRSQTPSSSGR